MTHQGYVVVANTRLRSSTPTMTSPVALWLSSLAAAVPGAGTGLGSVPWLPSSIRSTVKPMRSRVPSGLPLVSGGAAAVAGVVFGSDPWLP